MALQIKGRIFSIIIILFTAVALSSSTEKAQPSTNTSEVVVSTEKLVDDILDYVNEYRAKKGLPALQMNTVISAVAEKHSDNMARKKTAFGHDGFEDRVKSISQKLGAFRRSAENVAYGNLNAREVVDIWLKSPGHRRNIEGNYTVTGIGTASTSDGTIFFTQIFGAK